VPVGRMRNEGTGIMIANERRLHRVKKRLLLQIALAFPCNVLFVAVLSRIQERAFIANWISIAVTLAFLKFVPLLVVEWVNWTGAKPGISEMWAYGQSSFEDLSRELADHKTIEVDLKFL
jgi:hypothetical protein